MNLSLSERVNAFVLLGKDFQENSQWIESVIKPSLGKIYNSNGWFTEFSVLNAFASLSNMLDENNLVEWISRYKFSENIGQKKVGIIMAGNIPLVGFHDMLCVLISGNTVIIKTSKDDAILPRLVCEKLFEIEPKLKSKIEFVERLESFDAVIATGSNNSARYFESYFGKYPNIIRKNRTSVSVLNGLETKSQLTKLGHDIFDYFGLGCRNVTKMYVPKGYEFAKFFESIYDFGFVANVNKYANNYDYNRAVYLMNSLPFLDNNFLIIRESEDLTSPVSVVNYEFYDDVSVVAQQLVVKQEQVQCVVSDISVIENAVTFGNSQKPMLWDYADGIDTINFLNSLL
jgi:hypothetical protein